MPASRQPNPARWQLAAMLFTLALFAAFLATRARAAEKAGPSPVLADPFFTQLCLLGILLRLRSL